MLTLMLRRQFWSPLREQFQKFLISPTQPTKYKMASRTGDSGAREAATAHMR
jgi:hypothetical protein